MCLEQGITYAQIAQSVEQGTENPRVAGSIPALGIGSFISYNWFLTNKKLYSRI